jgi:hypothetical protein
VSLVKAPEKLYNLLVDAIRRLATQRHFFTAQLTLKDYGQVLLIGDESAVERLADLVAGQSEEGLIDHSDEANRPVPQAG